MNNRLYVGQLSYSVDSESLAQIFADQGQVVSAKVIMDRDSGRSKGFGFVEMADEEQAQNAISSLNGREVMGRTINVSIAKPQEDRAPRGGGGGGRSHGMGGFRRGY